MRLHELSVAAFGPFVDEVSVDFDALSAAGLFLLTGDTGAGKSSVLDAVCFALYGEVPGDRHGAKHLRSDHAAPSAEPRVSLRLSIGERSFRFTRSPAWERPKRRGTGTTKVQAHVVVEEHRDGSWVVLTNRLDEAGQLVAGLLGMTVTQFTQVAMLPQGRFQAFLRASSAERQGVLQRLFRTRRFEEVERWLAERRLELHRSSTAAHARTTGVVNRIVEASGEPVPEEWSLDDLEPAMADDGLLTWTAGLAATASDLTLRLEGERSAWDQRLAAARARLERGTALVALHARGREARESLEQLEASAGVDGDLAASLDAHRRASAVAPALKRSVEAEARVLGAELDASRAVASVAALLGVPTAQVQPTWLSAELAHARESRAVAESWLPRETELERHTRSVDQLQADLAALALRQSADEQAHHQLAAQLEEHRAALEEQRVAAARQPTDRVAVSIAGAGLDAAHLVLRLEASLAATEARLAERTRVALDLRERHLDLRERRVAGMAAELASGLAVGCSCPVCGSASHPAPARVAGAVTRFEEDAARERHESADFERQAVQESVATLRAELAGARARSEGDSVLHWEGRLRQAEADLAVSTAAALALGRVQATHVETEKSLAEVVTRLDRTGTTITERSHRLRDQQAIASRLEAELAELLEAHPEADSVSSLVELHQRRAQELQAASDVLAAHERAQLALDTARGEAVELALEAGFGSCDEARGVLLAPDVAVSRAELLESRRVTRAAAEAVLADPEIASALALEPPGLDSCEHEVQTASESRDAAHAAHTQARSRETRIVALAEELAAAAARWKPVLHQHAAVAGLCSLVEGKSVDNRLKMRLSAYVLSERLRQVVAAANERLAAMTAERYSLEQADARGAGEQRGGLSLRVRDEWNGRHRDPATLSGGETFLVSLALALGLADTVSNEAGGTQLDTLFIDEGFGALDAATLDDVMDVLDSLRDGGRVVGVVSHVPELRNRVTAQLEVRKARGGSTVHQLLSTG